MLIAAKFTAASMFTVSQSELKHSRLIILLAVFILKALVNRTLFSDKRIISFAMFEVRRAYLSIFKKAAL